jgi:hypothetical protein
LQPLPFAKRLTSLFLSLTIEDYSIDYLEEIMAKAIAQDNPIDEIKRKGEKAAFSPIMDLLTRWGYAVKGFIYVAIGFLAIAGALGKSSTPADQLGAIAEFSKLPYAFILLGVVLIGLVSYSLWGVIRAILDPFHKGRSLEGLLTRGGFLLSAITYATFIVPTYHLIRGAEENGTNATVELVSTIMNMPMGRILVGAVGLAGIAAGLYQMYIGITMNFDQRFKPYALTPEQLKVARQVGRFGTAARGVVFTLVGFFLTLAAYQFNPGHARGFDAAFDFLARQPYGLWLLGIIAVGLIAFGLYSFMSAAWFKLKK